MGRRDIATGVIIIREKPISDQNMRGVKTVSRLFFVQAISGYEDNLLSGECDFGGVIGGEASVFVFPGSVIVRRGDDILRELGIREK